MKTLIVTLIALVVLVILYVGAVFLGFNLPKPEFLDKGIEGNAVLKVTLLMDNNLKNPLANIEVDVAKKPGTPPKGGVAVTDESGTATFKIKPGSYYIIFNDLTFPKNLEAPRPEQIDVVEGAVSEKTILVTAASR